MIYNILEHVFSISLETPFGYEVHPVRSWSASNKPSTSDFTWGVTWLKMLSVAKGFLGLGSLGISWNFPRPKMTQAILRVASLIWVCQQVWNLAATCSHCFWSGKPVLKALWHPTFLNALTLLGSRRKTVSGAVQKCPWLSHRSRTNQLICPSPG